MENLEVWNKYRAVPNNALKTFDNGNFEGTDINTMWRLKSLTEQFGICGIGWFYDIIRVWNEDVSQTGEVLTFAEIKLYIKIGNEWSKGISGVGGNKMVSYIKSKEYFKTNDEAVKMAVTDAIGVACKNLGFGADVYWANDKTKYSEFSIDDKELDKVQEETYKLQQEEIAKFESANPTTCVCSQCGEKVTEAVAKYSCDKFGKPLCYKCQKTDFKTKSYGAK